MGAEKAIPGLKSDPAQHHYRRIWRVFSKDVGKPVETLVGGRGAEILRRMQKLVLCNSMNIARSFKALVD